MAQATDQEIQEIRDMRSRQLEVAIALQVLGERELGKFSASLEIMAPGSLVVSGKIADPRVILALIKEGAALERVILGEPDTGDQDASRLTWPELVKASKQ